MPVVQQPVIRGEQILAPGIERAGHMQGILGLEAAAHDVSGQLLHDWPALAGNIHAAILAQKRADGRFSHDKRILAVFIPQNIRCRQADMTGPDARLDVELRLRLKGIAYRRLVAIGSIETAGIQVYQHGVPPQFSPGIRALLRS